MTGTIRVLIADDHPPTRAGVREALERGGCDVCAEVANADAAIAAALQERPDVCIVDLDMPGGGIRAVAEITARTPGARVVVLTVSSDPDDLFDALRAGACGFLLKDMDPAALPETVRRLAAGEGFLTGTMTARLIEQFRSRGSGHSVVLDDGRCVELTVREREILELLADDASTADMARRLFLSPITVRRHISTLLHKLGVSTRQEAARLVGHRPTDRRSRDT